MTEIVAAVTPEHWSAVRGLWTSYWSELGFTPCFQGFEQEIAALPGKYAPPGGTVLLALLDGQPAGGVAFRRVDTEVCEAKRLYVPGEFRGHGIARALMERLMADARAVGYRRMVGDTMPVMAAALELYERLGFRKIDRYDGATEGAIYIERSLGW